MDHPVTLLLLLEQTKIVSNFYFTITNRILARSLDENYCHESMDQPGTDDNIAKGGGRKGTEGRKLSIVLRLLSCIIVERLNIKIKMYRFYPLLQVITFTSIVVSVWFIFRNVTRRIFTFSQATMTCVIKSCSSITLRRNKKILKLNHTICNIKLFWTFISEPDGAPQNVRGEKTSSTSIIVMWDDVPVDKQNGIITGYTINYQSQTENHYGNVQARSSEREKELTNLKQSVNYNITVSAFTVKGNGPPSYPTIVVRTDKESK